MCPQRPQSHVLETQSRIAFDSQISAAGWVFERFAEDYGLDGRVEIFDDQQRARSQMFLVQLKATETPDLKDALRIRFRRHTADYLLRQALPVLVVLYHAPTRALYVSWFKALHAPDQSRQSAQTVSLRMDAECLWAPDTPSQLARDVAFVQRVTSSMFDFPLAVDVRLPSGKLFGVTENELVSATRDVCDQGKKLVNLASGPSDSAEAEVVVARDGFTIQLRGFRRRTFTYPSAYAPDPQILAADVLVGIGIGLFQEGQIEGAAALFERHAMDSLLALEPAATGLIGMALVRSQRIQVAIELAEQIQLQHGYLRAQSVGLALLSSAGANVNHDESVLRLFERMLAQENAGGRPETAAVCSYNLGNLLRLNRQYLKALKAYRRAADLDPTYTNRSYFWTEIAGMLFVCSRFTMSASLYERALRLGAPDDVKPLHADALLHSGEYLKAETALDAYTASNSDVSEEWIIKTEVVQCIRTYIGVDRQKRASREAMKFAESHDETGLRHALSLDALCGLAWFNLAAYYGEVGRYEDQTTASVITAQVQRWDIEAWGNAIMGAFSSSNWRAYAAVLMGDAYDLHGEAIVKQITETARKQPNALEAEQYLNSIEPVFEWLRRRVDQRAKHHHLDADFGGVDGEKGDYIRFKRRGPRSLTGRWSQ